MGREWERVEEGEVSFMSNLELRWTDPVTARSVSKYVKGIRKRARGNRQGEAKEQGGCAMYIVNQYMCI